MPAVKIPESLRSDLAKMNLTVWMAMHPMDYNYEVNGQRGKGRHDTSRVMVQLIGPGIEDAPWGYGGNLQEAVNHALSSPAIRDRVKGLKGAMMRLDAALRGLTGVVRLEAWITAGAYEDEIPF